MWIITTFPYGERDPRKAYFRGYEWGLPCYSFKRSQALPFRTKQEALAVARKGDNIERIASKSIPTEAP